MKTTIQYYKEQMPCKQETMPNNWAEQVYEAISKVYANTMKEPSGVLVPASWYVHTTSLKQMKKYPFPRYNIYFGFVDRPIALWGVKGL